MLKRQHAAARSPFSMETLELDGPAFPGGDAGCELLDANWEGSPENPQRSSGRELNGAFVGPLITVSRASQKSLGTSLSTKASTVSIC
jgi:hypothetical protein